MPRLRPATPIGPHILPKHRIALNRPKGDSPFPFRRLILAIQKLTPLRIPRLAQPREIRTSTFTSSGKVHHKRAYSVSAAPARRASPIVVVHVVASHVVSLRPHALDVEVWFPALECARAMFDAPDNIVAGEQGAVGETFRRVGFGRVCVFRRGVEG